MTLRIVAGGIAVAFGAWALVTWTLVVMAGQ